MAERLEQIRFLDVTTSMLPYGIPFPVVPESTEIMNHIIPDMLQNALTETMTVQEAADDAAQRVGDVAVRVAGEDRMLQYARERARAAAGRSIVYPDFLLEVVSIEDAALAAASGLAKITMSLPPIVFNTCPPVDSATLATAAATAFRDASVRLASLLGSAIKTVAVLALCMPPFYQPGPAGGMK
jgi:hypothetical protein